MALEEFCRSLPLQGGYALEATFLEVNGRNVVIGFPEDHRMAAMNLERPNIRSVFEQILSRLSGQKLVLKMEVRADIEAAPAPEVSAPPPPVAAAPEPAPEKAAAKQAKTAAADEAAADAARREEEFRSDPLIAEALRLFDAKITQVV